MMQAVLNLLNNAIKYSPDVKQIDVRVERRGETLGDEIADRGVGIPRSEHRKIFEKFYRIPRACARHSSPRIETRY